MKDECKTDQDKRQKQAVIAMYDYGSREGATSRRVFKQMKDAGFSDEEIAAAAKEML